MREKVLAAFIRGNEAETLCVVEPLDGTSSHDLEREVEKSIGRRPKTTAGRRGQTGQTIVW
jgi:hypothetical protein